MLNETSIGNVSFRSMPEGKRVSLRIGGIGLTIQQNTWNCLVRLAKDIGIVQSDVDDNRNVDNSEVIEDKDGEIEQVEVVEEEE